MIILEEWRELRVGDRIRIVRMPSEFDDPSFLLPRCDHIAYRRLVERHRPLRVCRVDADGLPWVDFRFRLDDGRWAYHWMAFNHDGWVRVRRRKRPS